MPMLKVYRGPSTEKLGVSKSQPDPAANGGIGLNISPSKVGAPHKRGAKTLGQKSLKPKLTQGKQPVGKGY